MANWNNTMIDRYEILLPRNLCWIMWFKSRKREFLNVSPIRLISSSCWICWVGEGLPYWGGDSVKKHVLCDYLLSRETKERVEPKRELYLPILTHPQRKEWAGQQNRAYGVRSTDLFPHLPTIQPSALASLNELRKHLVSVSMPANFSAVYLPLA